MTKMPRLTAKELVRLLEIAGFHLVRQKGSHQIYRHSFGVRATVPFHGSKILHPKIVRDCLKAIEKTSHS